MNELSFFWGAGARPAHAASTTAPHQTESAGLLVTVQGNVYVTKMNKTKECIER